MLSSFDISLRLTGPLNRRAQVELEEVAAICERLRGVARCSGTISIDLHDVSAFPRDALRSLNRVWTVLTESGWSVDITTPAQGDARSDFVRAAIRGTLAWARGTAHLSDDNGD